MRTADIGGTGTLPSSRLRKRDRRCKLSPSPAPKPAWVGTGRKSGSRSFGRRRATRGVLGTDEQLCGANDGRDNGFAGLYAPGCPRATGYASASLAEAKNFADGCAPPLHVVRAKPFAKEVVIACRRSGRSHGAAQRSCAGAVLPQQPVIGDASVVHSPSLVSGGTRPTRAEEIQG